MNKLFNLLRKYNFRLLDLYFGIIGFYIHGKILAVYGTTTVYIFSWSFGNLLHIDWQYHFNIGTEYPPAYGFYLNLFGTILVDTDKERMDKISRSVSAYMEENKARKQAARERLAEVDPELAEYI